MAQVTASSRTEFLVSEDELYAYIKARCSCAVEALHLFEFALGEEQICLSTGDKKTLIKSVRLDDGKLLVTNLVN